MRSTVALKTSSDADLTVFTKHPIGEKKSVSLLFDIKHQIEANLRYSKSLVLYDKPDKRVKQNVVMLKYEDYQTNFMNAVEKIDVVVDNYHGVNNSRLL